MKWRRETPYNFISLFDDVLTVFKETLDYAVNKRNLLGFLLFYATVIIGTLVVIPISLVILCSLHTIDLCLIYLVGKISDGMDDDRPEWVRTLSIITALLTVIPLLVFYTPGIIYSHFKEKKEKKLLEMERRIEITRDEVLRSWGRQAPPPQPYRDRGVKAKDFKPKKYLRPHNFNKERKARFISPGVYIREVDYSFMPSEGRYNNL
jgi:hypothetical protein